MRSRTRAAARHHDVDVSEARKSGLSEVSARIRTAALELFAERGFAATTTAEIAKQLGLNSQTVLNHKAKALESLRKSGTKFKWLLEGVSTH